MAYQETEIIGFLGLVDIYIAGIFIKSGIRGQGYGKELLTAAKVDQNQLILSVYQKNTHARHFYLKQGFQISKELLDETTKELELEMVWHKTP